MISGYTMEELRELNESVFRAIMREKTHHTVEFPLYRTLFADEKVSERMGDTLGKLLSLWEEREGALDKDDVQWSYTLLDLAQRVRAGETVQLPEDLQFSFSADEQATVQKLIETRRSIRIWTDDPVPQDLVRKVIEAGLWAPHACNLQTLRFVVVSGESEEEIFISREVTGWPVGILVGQDMRPYERYKTIPVYNRDLDCGAATQNMLLCAHALGLGGVWATFGKGEADKIHATLDLPEYIRLRTYIALGWPAQVSLPPGRISPDDAILKWV